MKKILIFTTLILNFSFYLACFEPADLDGGWLSENNYKRFQNGDEFFVEQMRTINISGKDYLYCLAGTLVDLSSNKPRFCISYHNDFDVIDLRKVSENCFDIELRNKYDQGMVGKIRVYIDNFDSFYFDVISGSNSFVSELDYFSKKKIRFYKLHKMK